MSRVTEALPLRPGLQTAAGGRQESLRTSAVRQPIPINAEIAGQGLADVDTAGSGLSLRQRIALTTERGCTVLLYLALLCFFLFVLFGRTSGSNVVSYACTVAIACVLALWVVYVIVKCVTFRRRRRQDDTDPPREGGRRNTSAVRELPVFMVAGLSPVRMGLEASARAKFDYFMHGSAGPPEGGGGKAWSLDDSCSICLAEYSEGDKLCRLPCEHKFHEDCISKWLDRCAECPMCKHALRLALVA